MAGRHISGSRRAHGRIATAARCRTAVVGIFLAPLLLPAASYQPSGHHGFVCLDAEEAGTASSFTAALSPAGAATGGAVAVQTVLPVRTDTGWALYVAGWAGCQPGVHDLTVHPNTGTAIRLPAAVTIDPPRLDVALLLDDSHSMRRTDPDRLRMEAVRQFAAAAARRRDVATLSIIAFNSRPRLLLPPTPPSHTSLLERALSHAASSGSTDLDAALQLAWQQLEALPSSRKVAVVLSDGRDEPGVYTFGHRPFAVRRWPVFTIGFSDEIDVRTLQMIADSTGGRFHPARSSADLVKIFQGIAQGLHRSVSVGEWPLQEGRAGSFPVDDTIRLLSLALLDRQGPLSCSLLPPGGIARALNTAMPAGAFAELFAPDRGAWAFRASGDAGALMVTAESDLELIVFPPPPDARAERGHPLAAAAVLGGQVLTGATLRAVWAGHPSLLLNDAGRDGDRTPGDSIHGGRMGPVGAGEHELHVVAEGRTPAGLPYRRALVKRWRMLPALPPLPLPGVALAAPALPPDTPRPAVAAPPSAAQPPSLLWPLPLPAMPLPPMAPVATTTPVAGLAPAPSAATVAAADHALLSTEPATLRERFRRWVGSLQLVHLLLLLLGLGALAWLVARALRQLRGRMPHMAGYLAASVLLHALAVLLTLDLLVQTRVVRLEQISPALAVSVEALEQALGFEITPPGPEIRLREQPQPVEQPPAGPQTAQETPAPADTRPDLQAAAVVTAPELDPATAEDPSPPIPVMPDATATTLPPAEAPAATTPDSVATKPAVASAPADPTPPRLALARPVTPATAARPMLTAPPQGEPALERVEALVPLTLTEAAAIAAATSSPAALDETNPLKEALPLAFAPMAPQAAAAPAPVPAAVAVQRPAAAEPPRPASAGPTSGRAGSQPQAVGALGDLSPALHHGNALSLPIVNAELPSAPQVATAALPAPTVATLRTGTAPAASPEPAPHVSLPRPAATTAGSHDAVPPAPGAAASRICSTPATIASALDPWGSSTPASVVAANAASAAPRLPPSLPPLEHTVAPERPAAGRSGPSTALPPAAAETGRPVTVARPHRSGEGPVVPRPLRTATSAQPGPLEASVPELPLPRAPDDATLAPVGQGGLAFRLGAGGEGTYHATIGMARYGGDWDSARTAMMFLGHQIAERTGAALSAGDRVIALDSPDLRRLPFVYMTGHRDFRFTEAEVTNLRAYLQAGGYLWADDSTHFNDETFDRAFRREILRVLPGTAIQRLDRHFAAFRTGYDLSRGYKGYAIPPGDKYRQAYIEGLAVGDRVAVVYTRNDYGDGLNIDGHTHPLKVSLTDLSPAEMQEGATRMGINLLLYFLSGGGQLESAFMEKARAPLRTAGEPTAPRAPVGRSRALAALSPEAVRRIEDWGDPATLAQEGGTLAWTFALGEKSAFTAELAPPLELRSGETVAIDVQSELGCGSRLAIGLTVGDRYFESVPFYLKPGPNVALFDSSSRHFKTEATAWSYRDALPLPAAVSKLTILVYSPQAGTLKLSNGRVIKKAEN